MIRNYLLSVLLTAMSFFLYGQQPENKPNQANGFTGKPRYQIITKRAGAYLGTTNIELFPLIAPLHAANFDSLVNDQFFDSTAFHRVIPGFMIQGGDPNSKHKPKSTWGMGNPSQQNINAEFSAAKHLRGILSAARDNDTNSANSQFFICVAAASWLDGQYSVFGQVTSGMNYVDTIVSEPRDANDNPYKKIEMFISYIGSNDSVPDAPSLTSPANTTLISTTSQLLKWSAVNSAILYRLEVAKDAGFTNMVFSKDVATTSYTITNLEGVTNYYWRVKTNNGGQYSAYSDVYMFNTPTGAPVLAIPANNSTNTFINPIFSWNKVPGATAYRLQVSRALNFATNNIAFDITNFSDTTIQVDSLMAGRKHYWRVYSIKDGVQGLCSDNNNFTTGTLAGISYLNPATKNELAQNAPNPSDDFTLINYSVERTNTIQLKIFDMQGRIIAQPLNEHRGKGNHTIIIDTKNYPNGIYFYQLQIGNSISTRRMIVSH